MKKFLCIIATILCLVPFTACSDTADSTGGLINLADCEIGYELPVYPDCEFNYTITRYLNGDKTQYNVHISSIKITLASINTIYDNETLSGKFYRYTLNLSASGTTETALAETTLYLNFYRSDSGNTLVAYQSETIDENGNVLWDKQIGVSGYVSFSFVYID